MFHPVRTYSRSKSRQFLKNIPCTDDVFPATQKSDLSTFSLSDSSGNEKENDNKISSKKRKAIVGNARKKTPKSVIRDEKIKKYNKNLISTRYSKNSSPRPTEISGHPTVQKEQLRKYLKGKETSKNINEIKEESYPSIELPRRESEVPWQEKISLLLPLMTNIYGKASNINRSGIHRVEEIDNIVEESDGEDESDQESDVKEEGSDVNSSQYTTTYTYTWVTDSCTKTPNQDGLTNRTDKRSSLVEVSPVQSIHEDIDLEEVELEVHDDKEPNKSSVCKVSQDKTSTSKAVSTLYDTMGFKKARRSEILNSTVKNRAAQNIKQAQFPSNLSNIGMKYVPEFIDPLSLSDKHSVDQDQNKILRVNDTKKTKRGKCDQDFEETKFLSTKSQLYQEKENIETDMGKSNKKKAVQILNSTRKSNARQIQEMEWANELSVIKPIEIGSSDTQMQLERTPNKVIQQPVVRTPKKAKKKNDFEKKNLTLQPKNSTLLFASDRVEFVDLVPDMSTIASGNTAYDKSTECGQIKKKFHTAAQTGPSPFILHIDSQKEQIGQCDKILTSTPAGSMSKFPAEELQFDISSVPLPSCDEDELDVQNSSREVNSLEIVPLHYDEDDSLQNKQTIQKKKFKIDSASEYTGLDSPTLVPEAPKASVHYHPEIGEKPEAPEQISQLKDSNGSAVAIIESQTAVLEKPKEKVGSLSSSDILQALPIMQKYAASSNKTVTNGSKLVLDGSYLKQNAAKSSQKSNVQTFDSSTIKHFKNEAGKYMSADRVDGQSVRRINNLLSSAKQGPIDALHLCPLTKIKKWPRRAAVLHIDIQPATVPIKDHAKRIPEDVLMLLDRKLRKKKRKVVIGANINKQTRKKNCSA